MYTPSGRGFSRWPGRDRGWHAADRKWFDPRTGKSNRRPRRSGTSRRQTRDWVYSRCCRFRL
ncbi:hypothetical protein HBB16_17940 [Pseudonocardia sp. MCCB 268]|nr:hypothetical protein [Pseudonocardia cytotoxica]